MGRLWPGAHREPDPNATVIAARARLDEPADCGPCGNVSSQSGFRERRVTEGPSGRKAMGRKVTPSDRAKRPCGSCPQKGRRDPNVTRERGPSARRVWSGSEWHRRGDQEGVSETWGTSEFPTIDTDRRTRPV